MVKKLSVILLVVFCAAVFYNAAEAAKPEPALQVPRVEMALAFLRNQIRGSGLLDSFVEDNSDYSYTYDDALAAMAFLSAGDTASARRVLDGFFNIGSQPEGGFLHRYYASSGMPADGILGAGHNAYLLQAMNMYYMKTGDAKYNMLAQGIANYIINLQAEDGGVCGKEGVAWKSAENNLGALSAIHNLGVAQNIQYYRDKAKEIQNFLIAECWDGQRFLTGEDDTMVVTDTQALGAIILGRQYSNGAYWIKNYTGTTKKYASRKTVTGFDENTDRDTVWIEGTLAEAMAFMVAGDLDSFNFYKTEAEKLFLSTGALYAATNTGTTGFDEDFKHWQAVAPTAWYVFVCKQDNVLAKK
ncbi:MAG: hypothetical protein PHO42_02090 [Candidatus Omnitrophica bacterium]|nr:hypothetical protein [Candidatus Omnitrophota bacterium]